MPALLEERQERLADPLASPRPGVYRRLAAGGASWSEPARPRGALARAPPSPASLGDRLRRRACRDRATRPSPRGRSWRARRASACFLVHREARTAPVAPAPSPSATQKPGGSRAPSPAACRGLLLEPAGALAQPGAEAMIFTSGLAAACSTSPESFSTRPTIAPESNMLSTRSISRFVRSTEPLTSRSSGTVSSRIASIIIFVLSRTRNVFSSTTQRNEDEQAPEAGEDDQRGVAAAECESVMVRVLLGSIGRCRLNSPRSIPSAGRVPTPLPVLRVLALAEGRSTRSLEPDRTVLLLDPVAGVVVRVPVPLPVAERLARRVATRRAGARARGRRTRRPPSPPRSPCRRCSTSARARGTWPPAARFSRASGSPTCSTAWRRGRGLQQRHRVGEPDVLATRARSAAAR